MLCLCNFWVKWHNMFKTSYDTLVFALAFCPKILELRGDPQMVLCHSMHGGWVMGTFRTGLGHTNFTSCDWIYLNFVHSEVEVAKISSLFPFHPSTSQEPPCETFEFFVNWQNWQYWHERLYTTWKKSSGKMLPLVGIEPGSQVQHYPFYNNLTFACKTETLGSLYSHALLIPFKSI